MEQSKVKIGLMLDSRICDAWEYDCIEKIRDSEYASIELVVLNDEKHTDQSSSSFKYAGWPTVSKYAAKYIINAYRNKSSIKNTACDALRRTSLSDVLQDIKCVCVKTVRQASRVTIADDDLESIMQENLDVLIMFGFQGQQGRIFNACKLGIWKIYHSDTDCVVNAPPGLWEVLESWPVCGSELRMHLNDNDRGILLYKSYSSTDNRSITSNNNKIYWKTAAYISRQLKYVSEMGCKEYMAYVQNKEKMHFYTQKIHSIPTAYWLFSSYFRKMIDINKERFDNLMYLEQWSLAYSIKSDISTEIESFETIRPPADRFWADPHFIYKNNKYYIFIEEMVFGSNKAHISLIEMDETGKYGKAEPVLARPYHLSYPFVFEYEDDFYMVPETCANRTIELYRCVEFPNKWEFVMNLLEDIYAVDTTIYYFEGKWWLFANVVENEYASSWDELYLYYSDSILSNRWIPHCGNPVVSDVKSSRPAGALFEYNGKLYRPSQNSSYRYGYGLKFNEVICLNEDEYREVEISSITPEWCRDVLGVHTFNRKSSLTILDVLVRRRKMASNN